MWAPLIQPTCSSLNTIPIFNTYSYMFSHTLSPDTFLLLLLWYTNCIGNLRVTMQPSTFQTVKFSVPFLEQTRCSARLKWLNTFKAGAHKFFLHFRNGGEALACGRKRPSVPALGYIWVWSTGEMVTDTVKPKCLNKVPQCHTLSSKNPTWIILRLNPGLHDEKAGSSQPVQLKYYLKRIPEFSFCLQRNKPHTCYRDLQVNSVQGSRCFLLWESYGSQQIHWAKCWVVKG
jgi:hypothetical protein